MNPPSPNAFSSPVDTAHIVYKAGGVKAHPLIRKREWGQSTQDFLRGICAEVARMGGQISGWMEADDKVVICEAVFIKTLPPTCRKASSTCLPPPPPPASYSAEPNEGQPPMESAPSMDKNDGTDGEVEAVEYDNICGDLPASLSKGLLRRPGQSVAALVREAHIFCFSKGFAVVGNKDTMFGSKVVYLIIEPLPDGMGG